MTNPDPAPTAVGALVVSVTAAIFGEAGPSVAFLLTLLLYSCAGAMGRLFLDAASGEFTVRRQCGFVLVSVVTAFATAFVLWHSLGVDYPTVVMGWAIVMALLGPVDALGLLRGVIERVLVGAGQERR